MNSQRRQLLPTAELWPLRETPLRVNGSLRLTHGRWARQRGWPPTGAASDTTTGTNLNSSAACRFLTSMAERRNIEKVKNLIKGFTLHNNLTKDEIFSLNILAKGASLRFLITRLFDWYNTPKNSYVKRKDPQEYIDKLLYFNSNTLDFLYD